MEGKREAAGGEGRRKAAQGREDEGGKYKKLQSNSKRVCKYGKGLIHAKQLPLGKRHKVVWGWRQVSAGGWHVPLRVPLRAAAG